MIELEPQFLAPAGGAREQNEAGSCGVRVIVLRFNAAVELVDKVVETETRFDFTIELGA